MKFHTDLGIPPSQSENLLTPNPLQSKILSSRIDGRMPSRARRSGRHGEVLSFCLFVLLLLCHVLVDCDVVCLCGFACFAGAMERFVMPRPITELKASTCRALGRGAG